MDYAYDFSLSEMDKYFKIKNNVIIQWQTLQTVTQYSHGLSSFCFFFFLSEIVIMQNVKEQALATYTIRELFFFGYANVCRR